MKLNANQIIVITVLAISLIQIALTTNVFYQITSQKELNQKLADQLNEIKTSTNKDNTDTTKVSLALAQLREELIRYRAEQLGRDQILGLSTLNSEDQSTKDPYSSLSTTIDKTLATLDGETAGTTNSSMVKLSPNWSNGDVFESPKASSKIIGAISPNQSYLVISKENNWYQIKLSPSSSGWVQGELLYEVN